MVPPHGVIMRKVEGPFEKSIRTAIGDLFRGHNTDFDQLRLSTHTGRPAGVCAFVEKISNFIQRDFKKGAPGRPRKK